MRYRPSGRAVVIALWRANIKPPLEVVVDNLNRVKTEIGATKRKKIRTVDFCDTLAAILKTAKAEQHKNCFRYGELYSLNYYSEVKEKDCTYYEVYSLPRTEEVPEGYIAR